MKARTFFSVGDYVEFTNLKSKWHGFKGWVLSIVEKGDGFVCVQLEISGEGLYAKPVYFKKVNL